MTKQVRNDTATLHENLDSLKVLEKVNGMKQVIKLDIEKVFDDNVDFMNNFQNKIIAFLLSEY